jgi:2,3-bisphosphoglycerate-independent phosphoglycerate mutase
MKFITLLGDGMADEPVAELDGKTPLQAAATPNMDQLARTGIIGLAETVPQAFHPGSDVANLSVFGYDPAACYSGRSPLEAASMGVELSPEDVAFRLNLVTLSLLGGDLCMHDFSAGHISTAEARELIACLQEELGDGEFQFYPGVSYRHLMVWKGGRDDINVPPPHDLTGQSVTEYVPRSAEAMPLMNITNAAQLLLKQHPVNVRREKEGQNVANSIWLWGQGRRPSMPTLRDKFNLSGAVISAVDLIKGIGIYAGLDVINVPGATGYLDTNYKHVEAPDEAAHSGSLEDKIEAIERFDADVVGTVMAGIGSLGDYRVLLLPDHPTPVAKMTHTKDPVPFVLAGSGVKTPDVAADEYSEAAAKKSGILVNPGHQVMSLLINGKSL